MKHIRCCIVFLATCGFTLICVGTVSMTIPFLGKDKPAWSTEPVYPERGQCLNVSLTMAPRGELYKLVYEINTTASFYRVDVNRVEDPLVHVSDTTTTRTLENFHTAVAYMSQMPLWVDFDDTAGTMRSTLSHEYGWVHCYWTKVNPRRLGPQPPIVLVIGVNNETMMSDVGIVVVTVGAIILLMGLVCIGAVGWMIFLVLRKTAQTQTLISRHNCVRREPFYVPIGCDPPSRDKGTAVTPDVKGSTALTAAWGQPGDDPNPTPAIQYTHLV